MRRGLRIEFCRPNFPASPSTHASGRPMTRRQRASHGRSQHGGTDEDAHGAEADQSDSRDGEADDQHDHADQSDGPAPGETATGRDVCLGLAVAEGGHRGDTHGPAGRPDRGDDRHADAYRQAHQYGADLEHERPGR